MKKCKIVSKNRDSARGNAQDGAGTPAETGTVPETPSTSSADTTREVLVSVQSLASRGSEEVEGESRALTRLLQTYIDSQRNDSVFMTDRALYRVQPVYPVHHRETQCCAHHSAKLVQTLPQIGQKTASWARPKTHRGTRIDKGLLGAGSEDKGAQASASRPLLTLHPRRCVREAFVQTFDASSSTVGVGHSNARARTLADRSTSYHKMARARSGVLSALRRLALRNSYAFVDDATNRPTGLRPVGRPNSNT